MSDAVGQQTSKHGSNGVTKEPDAVSEGLLLSLVPHSGDQRESRRDGCFSGTEKEASNDKTLEVLNCSVTDQDDSPDKAVSQVRFCSLHRGLN
jgi:hypothetical protein